MAGWLLLLSRSPLTGFLPSVLGPSAISRSPGSLGFPIDPFHLSTHSLPASRLGSNAVNPPLSALLTILLNTFPGAGGRSSVEECEPGPQRALGSILSMLFGLRLYQHLGGAWCGTGAIQASCFVNPKAQHLQTGSHFPSDEGLVKAAKPAGADGYDSK